MSHLKHMVAPSIEILHNLKSDLILSLILCMSEVFHIPSLHQVKSQYKIFTNLLLETTRDLVIYFSNIFTLDIATILIEDLFESYETSSEMSNGTFYLW